MKILLVSPCFAPFAGVGSMRMTSLAKYLRNEGVEVTVVRTVPDYYGIDSLKLPQPEGLQYHDVDLCDTLQHDNDIRRHAKTYCKAMDTLLQQQSFDCAVYTGGPHYGLVNAPHFKRKYGLPYSVDFRDLWVYNSRHTSKAARLFLSQFKRIEKSVIAHSSFTTAVTNDDAHILREHYVKHAQKVVVIPNGYEEEDIPPPMQCVSTSKIVVAVFGKMSYYSKEMTLELFKGLGKLVKGGYDIDFMDLGSEDPAMDAVLAASEFPLKRYFRTGYVAYKDGLKMLQTTRICVLVCGDHTGFGTKIFDYIALDKPVIAMIPSQRNELAQFIQQFKHGFVCNQAQQVAASVQSILDNNITQLSGDSSLIKSFSRTKRNEEYYRLLRTLCRSRTHVFP